MKRKSLKPNRSAVGIATAFLFAVGCSTMQAASLAGSVQVAGKPIAGANVTLYAASTSAPVKLAEAKTDNQGAFKLNAGQASKNSVLYVTAKGPKEDAALLSVLGEKPPATITMNELTTVASAFTAADSSTEKQSPATPLDFILLPGMFPTWWIPKQVSGAK